MISLCLWFAILSSGGMLCAAVWDKRYEETIPITSSMIVVILFLFGIVGNMRLGAIAVCTVSAGMILFSIAWIIIKKKIRTFIGNFFTSAFVIFGLLCVAIVYLNVGRMATQGDEFSHWADIVKVFTTIDDFGTNAKAYSMYKNYPPAMSLFQYFCEKVYIWFGNGTYSEWRMYAAYQIFALTYFMPFLNKRKIYFYIFSLIIILLFPLVYYSTFYDNLMIDSFLGILSGTGLAMVFISRKKDTFYTLRVLLTCIILTLSKDAGMFFAVTLACAYVWDYCSGQKGTVRGKFLVVGGAICSFLIPKLLWNGYLKLHDANPTSVPIDFKVLIQIILNKIDNYQRITWEEFWKALFTRMVSLGNIGIGVNYIAIILINIVLLYAIIVWYIKSDESYSKIGKILMAIVSIQYVLYIIGLCLTYVFKFGSYEGPRLASYERYMNIAMLSVWTTVIMLIVFKLQTICKENWGLGLAVAAIIITVSANDEMYGFISRDTVKESIEIRDSYTEICDKIMDCATGESNIYIVQQELKGTEGLVMKYLLRPNRVAGASIGEPFYDGDVWTHELTAEEWIEDLCENYDLVVLYKLNDYFYQEFSSAFADPNDIEEKAVYAVNSETRLLEKCE
jgi:hypothetical protein